MILFNEVNEEYIAILNAVDNENFILPKAMKLEMTYKSEPGLSFEGYTIIFADQIDDYYRKCLNFDYIEMLLEDKQNLEEIYLDEHVSMIIYNYLLIYWEYNKSKEMIKTLLKSVEKRVEAAENTYLIINFLQMKRVIGFEYSKEEIKLLADTVDTEDTMLKLAVNILLQRKLESTEIYDSLEDEYKSKFNKWPIKYLYN